MNDDKWLDGLSARAAHCLLRNGCHNRDEARLCYESGALARTVNAGVRTVLEVRDWLAVDPHEHRDLIHAAVALLKREGYTVTPPE